MGAPQRCLMSNSLGPNKTPSQMRSLLLLAALFLDVALWGDDGTLGVISVPAMVACVAVLWRYGKALTRRAANQIFQEAALWPFLLAVPVLLNLLRLPGAALLPGTSFVPHIVLALGLYALGMYGIYRRDHDGLAGLAAVTYLAVGMYLLAHSPNPRIDVFIIQQEGAAQLLKGRDPYVAMFSNPYTLAESLRFLGRPISAISAYPYPPLALLFSTLWYAIFKDVRVGYLLMQTGTGLLLYGLGRRRGLGLGLMCLHFLHPRGFLVLENAWTEPLLAAVVALWVTWRQCVLPKTRSPLGAVLGEAVFFSVVLSTKQYAVLLLPLCFRRRFVPKALALHGRRFWALGLALLFSAGLGIAFLCWHPADFVADVALFQLRQPFRSDALSLAAVFYGIFKVRPPGVLALLGATLPLVWLWRFWPRGTAGLVTSAVFAFLGFFLCAKQAFCNYYYFIGVLLLLSAALVHEADEEAVVVQ